jgi:1-deoxy-D-xylulose-5-phosphate synthase
VAPSLAAAELLAAQGVSATVVNARFASPVDTAMFTGLAQSTGRIVTVEEGVVAGGFGSAVSEMLGEQGIVVPHLRLGVPNEFVLHGKRDELLNQVGLDADGIAKSTLAFVRQSRHQYT